MAVIRFGRRSGVYPEFSNFFRRRFKFRDWIVPHGEAAYQLMKAPRRAEDFLILNPQQAKRLGRTVCMDSDFGAHKFEYMNELVYEKFSQHEDLKAILLSTGNDFIVENTTGWHDCIWGCCSCGTNRCNKLARNGLGFALMIARQKIRGEEDTNLQFKFGTDDCEISLNYLLAEMESGNKEAFELVDMICRRGI